MNNVSSIPPHKYPLWVVILSTIVFASFVYSLFFLPKYFVASQELKSGHNAYKEQKYINAIRLYESVLEKVPSSKEAKMSIAEAYFATAQPSNFNKAMSYLQGVELDKYDWERLTISMPKEYQKYFDKINKN